MFAQPHRVVNVNDVEKLKNMDRIKAYCVPASTQSNTYARSAAHFSLHRTHVSLIFRWNRISYGFAR